MSIHVHITSHGECYLPDSVSDKAKTLLTGVLSLHIRVFRQFSTTSKFQIFQGQSQLSLYLIKESSKIYNKPLPPKTGKYY